MSETVTAYPLSWPTGRPRTSPYKRERAPFSKRETVTRGFGDSTYRSQESKDITIAVARERLQREIELLRVTNIVLSTNIELRLDGQPRSGRNPPDDPGVALYFKYKGTPTVLACDRFTTVAGNIAAIAAHIDGMRKAERHGVGSLEQMFRGFTALPSGLAPMDWRAILGDCSTLERAEFQYRLRMKTGHPDVGGSEVRAAELNAAIDLARKHFRGQSA